MPGLIRVVARVLARSLGPGGSRRGGKAARAVSSASARATEKLGLCGGRNDVGSIQTLMTGCDIVIFPCDPAFHKAP